MSKPIGFFAMAIGFVFKLLLDFAFGNRNKKQGEEKMTDLLDKKLGPVEISASFSGGKLLLTEADPAVGVSNVTAADGTVIVSAIEAALDAEFPSAKSVVDLVMGFIKAAIAKS